MAITRGQLRRRIAGRLGDVQDLIATEDGSNTTLIDAIRLSGAIEQPKNRDIVFTSGPNQGVTRRVTGWDLVAGFVDFADVPDVTTTGDKAELYNFRGRGWRVEEYNDAINQALVDASDLARVRMGYAPDPYDAHTGLIPITNPDMTHLVTLSYEGYGGIYETVPHALNFRGEGWSYDPTIQSIDVRGGVIPGGAILRVQGFKRPDPLITDSDVTSINAEWLTVKACHVLCMAAISRDPSNYNEGMVYGQEAEQTRSCLRTRIPRGTVAVYP